MGDGRWAVAPRCFLSSYLRRQVFSVPLTPMLTVKDGSALEADLANIYSCTSSR